MCTGWRSGAIPAGAVVQELRQEGPAVRGVGVGVQHMPHPNLLNPLRGHQDGLRAEGCELEELAVLLWRGYDGRWDIREQNENSHWKSIRNEKRHQTGNSASWNFEQE